MNLAADLNLNIKGYFEQNRLLKRAKNQNGISPKFSLFAKLMCATKLRLKNRASACGSQRIVSKAVASISALLDKKHDQYYRAYYQDKN